MTSTQFPRLLSDAEVDADFFGSHQRVASALSSLINTADEKPRIVGLLGPWGSGKSTVLRILAKELSKQNENNSEKKILFLYDAWIHQSDPPRRSFLEEIIRFFDAEKPGLKERWKDDVDRLNRRLEETDTVSSPVISKIGLLFIITILVATIGFKEADFTFFQKLLSTYPTEWPFKTFVVLSTLSLPLITALTVYFFWRPVRCLTSRSFWTKENLTRNRKPYEEHRLTGFFLNKSRDHVRNRITKSIDPTAIEFQETFSKLMNEVAENNKRYIFVVDNLDRISEIEALTMWATIRSFFIPAYKSSTQNAYQPPIVILPLDSEAIQRVFSQTHNTDTADALAKSFIDKTFDVTFRVSPPVLSDWQSFFSKKLVEAFDSTIDENSIFAATRFYEAFVASETAGVEKKDAIVTPRSVVKLINTMVSLKLQAHDEISFASIAYYATHQRRIESNIKLILTSTDEIISGFEKKWRDELASIYYGVPKSKALQVLLEQELQQTIRTANTEEFKKLSAIPGFENVLFRLTNSLTRAEVEPEFIANSASLLKVSEIQKTPRIVATIGLLRSGLEKIRPWIAIPNAADDGLAFIFNSFDKTEHSSAARSASIVLGNLSSDLVAIGDTSVRWSGMAQAISQTSAVKESKITELVVPGNSEFFLSAISAGKLGDDLIGIAKPSSSVENVISTLADSAGDYTNVEAKVFALMKTRIKWPWNAFTVAAREFVEKTPPNNTGFARALNCLGALRLDPKSGAQSQIKSLYDNGHLFNKLHFAHEKKLQEAEAALISTLILANPNFEGGNQHENSEAGRQIAINLRTTLADRTEIIPLISKSLFDHSSNQEIAQRAKSNPAVVDLIKKIFSAKVSAKEVGTLKIDDTINSIETYFQIIEKSEHDNFIMQLTEHDGFWDIFGKAKLHSSKIRILSELIAKSGEIGKKAREILVSNLQEISADQWKEKIASGVEPIQLLLQLSKISEEPDIGEHLYQAIQDTVQKFMSTNDVTTEQLQRAITLSGAIKHWQKETLYKNIRDRVISMGANKKTFDLLNSGGADLIEKGQFAAKADEIVRLILIPSVDTNEGKEWISNNGETAKVIISRADSATKTTLQEKIENSAKSDDANLASRSKQLIEILALNERRKR